MINTDSAAQGEWVKHIGKLGATYLDTPEYIYVRMPGFLVDRIIADHRKAQMVDVLAKALEDMAVESNRGKLRPALWYMGHARAALAQFHDATEETTK